MLGATWCAVTLASRNGSPGEPVTSIEWDGQARLAGAFLIAPINQEFIDSICSQIENHLSITTITLKSLVTSRLLEEVGISNDVGFMRRLSYSLIKTETAYKEIIQFVDQNLICPQHNNTKKFELLVKTFKNIWDNILKVKSAQELNDVAEIYYMKRPSTEPQTEKFAGAVVGGLAVGSLIGVAIANLFKKDNSKEVETLNDNIKLANRNIHITNERIDVLSKNLSTSINQIKTILDSIAKLNYEHESKYSVTWNVEQIKIASSNILILLKVADNTLTLLRSGYLNSDLLDLETFSRVIEEGKNVFSEMVFPIKHLSRENIPDIVKLLEIKHIGANKFVMIIPLVRNTEYKIFSLIPNPIRFPEDNTFIIEISELILLSNNDYVITNSKDIQKISDSNYIIQNIIPIFNLNTPSCEWESYNKNISFVLKSCNFKKLGVENSIYLTETINKRLLYTEHKQSIQLDCPKKTLRQDLIGMNVIPSECDITTNSVYWPAKLTKNIDIKKVISGNKKGSSFDITNLPIYQLNDSSKLHNTIKTQINSLKTDKPFTFDFDEMTIKEVQSYSIIAYGIITVFVALNSLLIGILYIYQIKKWIAIRKRKGNNDEESNYSNRFRKSFDSYRDSLRRARNRTSRRARNHFRNLRRASTRSFDSARSSIKRKFERNKKHSISRESSPSLSSLENDNSRIKSVSVSTNTDKEDGLRLNYLAEKAKNRKHHKSIPLKSF